MNKIEPLIGDWYLEKPTGQLFEVVAIDRGTAADLDTIEVQYLDGEVDEFDRDCWGQLDLETAVPPEDWWVAYEISDDESPERIVNGTAIDMLVALESTEPAFAAESSEFDDEELLAS